MFYSHEILASPQYGVATVWLVANLGHNSKGGKLNRKQIEKVNVPHACNTIEKPPGAPIALRLQGNLLYGVAGVYSKQGVYLLDDTEKMWTRMRTFYRAINNLSETDPKAGKSKRKQLVIEDDPNFVPTFDLPVLEFDERGDLIFPDADISQRSKFHSQFSPLESRNGTSPTNAPLINLGVRHSSSQRSLDIAASFDKDGANHFDDSMAPIFCDEELPFVGAGLGIDADGNFIEEPELPPHPVQQTDENGDIVQKIHSGAQLPEEHGPLVHEDDEIQALFGEEEQQLPMATQIATRNDKDEVRLPSEEPLSSEPTEEQQPAKPKKSKQHKHHFIAADEVTEYSRHELKQWDTGYMARTLAGRDVLPNTASAAKAKKNAYKLVFGVGISDVGIFNGFINNDIVPNHELAELFSGVTLKSRVLELDEPDVNQGNRRRSASVAFGSEDEEGVDARHVRQRLDEAPDASQGPGQQAGRSQHDAQMFEDNGMVMFGDDQGLIPEDGRERPGSALSDHRRSSNAPWNRPSSAVPSSAAKNVEAGRRAFEGSPIVGRGSILQPSDIKFSDGGAAAFGSEGFAQMQHDGANDFSSYSEFGAAAGVSTQEANTSQFMRTALDREGRNFLSFMKRVAMNRGVEDAEDESLRYVNFDGLFEEEDKTKTVVAQAFLHVLTLATKNQIRVTQDGVKDKVPYGKIRVGVIVQPGQANETDKMEVDIQEGEDEYQTTEE